MLRLLLPIALASSTFACGDDAAQPASDTSPLDAADTSADVAPDVIGDASPDTTTPDTGADTTLDVADTAPDASPDTTTPDAPDTTPDVAETTPDVAPDTTADATPDVGPDTSADTADAQEPDTATVCEPASGCFDAAHVDGTYAGPMSFAVTGIPASCQSAVTVTVTGGALSASFACSLSSSVPAANGRPIALTFTGTLGTAQGEATGTVNGSGTGAWTATFGFANDALELTLTGSASDGTFGGNYILNRALKQ